MARQAADACKARAKRDGGATRDIHDHIIVWTGNARRAPVTRDGPLAVTWLHPHWAISREHEARRGTCNYRMKALKDGRGQQREHDACEENARRPPDRPYELVGQILGLHRHASEPSCCYSCGIPGGYVSLATRTFIIRGA